MKTFCGLLWLAALVFAGPAAAKDPNGSFAVKGVGTLRCQAYLDAAEAGEAELAQYAGYITGYVSAYNEHTPNTFDLLPWQTIETMMLLMVRGCRQAPALGFGAALTQLVQTFVPGRVTVLGERTRIGTSNVEVHAKVLEAIEAALAARGYDIEDIDAAISSFKRDEALAEPDAVGQLTLLRLLYGGKAAANPP